MYRVNLNEGGFFRFRTGNDSRASIPGERSNEPPDTEPESRSHEYYGYYRADRGVHSPKPPLRTPHVRSASNMPLN